MTITLQWWSVPLLLFLAGVITTLFTRTEGSYMPFPSWHLFGGIVMCGAAVCITIGHFL